MTVSSTNGTQLTVNELVRLAYVLAGLLEETQTLAAVGGGSLARTLLGVLTVELQAMGITARAGSFYNLTLTEGTFEYTMPSNVLDVFGDAMYIGADEADVNEASSETLVAQMSADEWHSQSAKDATGRPQRYFCLRTTTPPVVRLWPIPDEDGTVRLQIHRHLADSLEGSATPDLENYWTSYLMFRLAAVLAESKSMPGDKVGRLNSQAKNAIKDARAMSATRIQMQMVVTHGGPGRR